MKNDIQKFYLLLSKTEYSWVEVITIIACTIGAFVLQDINALLFSDGDFLPKSAVFSKVLTSLFVGGGILFCITWSKLIKTKEICDIEAKYNQLEREVGEASDR